MSSADFTIADVLAWARTKPADESYSFNDRFNCALCRFLKDTGRADAPVVSSFVYVESGGWTADDGAFHPYDRALEGPLSGEVTTMAWDHSAWTFGGLVERLEKLCPETPVDASNWQSIDAYLTDIEDVSRERVLS